LGWKTTKTFLFIERIYMTPLDLKKMKVELLRVSAAKAELELRIDERMDEISRIKENIRVQELKEIELKTKIDAEGQI